MTPAGSGPGLDDVSRRHDPGTEDRRPIAVEVAVPRDDVLRHADHLAEQRHALGGVQGAQDLQRRWQQFHGQRPGNRPRQLLSAGFAVQWNDRISTYAYYDGKLFRTNYLSNNVSAGFRVTF